MKYVALKGKIIEDNSLIPEEMPILLTEVGALEPLVDYFLEYDSLGETSRNKTEQSVRLLLDFMSANRGVFDEPEEMFRVFVKRLKSGTIGKDGTDPSGLYWPKRSPGTAGPLIYRLTEFSDFMAKKYGTKPLNPFTEATGHEEQLNWAAYMHKKHRSFFAHIWKDEQGKKETGRTRRRKGDPKLVSTLTETKNFPKDHIFDLLFKGFARPGKQVTHPLCERFNLRNILITILLHGGGLRLSEPFHLYVHDVCEDPLRPECALVRVYHPKEGTAPPDLLDAWGNPIKGLSREDYLLKKFGMKPRDSYLKKDRLHAGWKDPLLNNGTDNFMQVFWFPTFWGRLFWKLWHIYLQQLLLVERHHPFAFVNFSGPNIGDPYSMESFSKTCKGELEKGAHPQAVKKIGLLPCKNEGTTPHGHRHCYANALNSVPLGENPTEHAKIIQSAMHHKSIESQLVYGLPTVTQVTKAMASAEHKLTQGKDTSALPDMTKYGFETVDPLGLFSGPFPKLIGRF